MADPIFEALCSLIRNSEIKNGKVHDNIWLGRCKGNTIVCTESMPDFAQAQADEQKRNIPKTSKYEVGQVVSSLNTDYVYCGEWYKYFEIEEEDSDWWNKGIKVNIFKNPIKQYVFIDKAFLRYSPSFYTRKPRYIVSQEFMPEVPKNTFYNYTEFSSNPNIPQVEYEREILFKKMHKMQFGLEKESPIKDPDEVYKVVSEYYSAYRTYYKNIKININIVG